MLHSSPTRRSADMAGSFYSSVQTARLADQVAAQTAVLSQMKANRASTLVKAGQAVPTSETTSAVVENVAPQERWVF